MQTPELLDRPKQQELPSRKFTGDEIETITRVLEITETLELNDADKQTFRNAVELLLQEPDHPSVLAIEDPFKKAQLKSEYTIITSAKDHSLAALQILEKLQNKGTLRQKHIEVVTGMLLTYTNQLQKYERATTSDNSNTKAAELYVNKDELQQFLELQVIPNSQWSSMLAELQAPIPDPTAEQLKKYNESYRAFIALQKNDAETARTAVISMLSDTWQIHKFSHEQTIDPKERAIIIESIHVYLKHRKQYMTDTENFKETSMLNTVSATVASELSEEIFEEFGERFDSLELKEIKLLSAATSARAQMLANGVSNAPSVGEIFKRIGSNGVNVLRETARVVSPRHTASLIVFMFYLQSSEDKTRALLSYSTFMGASKGLDKISALLSKAPGVKNISARLAKIKAPVAIKFAIIITAGIYGGEYIEGAISSLERRADPTIWDASGNVMGILSAPLDVYAQLGGSAFINTQHDQFEYLTFEAGIAQNTGLTAPAAQKRIKQWDQIIEAYASTETNPTRKELIQLESIHNGPGGYDGWVSRQALNFYQMFGNVEALENEINAEVIKYGVQTPALSLAYLLRNDTSMTGDRNVRHEMVYNQEIYTAFFTNVQNRKIQLQNQLNTESTTEKKTELEEVIKGLDQLLTKYTYYEHFVKQADKKRSDYVRLGVFDLNWITKKPDQTLPPIVLKGLYSTLDLEGKRRDALANYKDSKDLAELIEQDGPPTITLDPVGFIGYFFAKNATWDNRIFSEKEINAAKEFTEQIGREIPQSDRDTIFQKLFNQLSSTPDKTNNGRAVMSQIIAAYSDYYFEGTISDGSKFAEGSLNQYNQPKHLPRLSVLSSDRYNRSGFTADQDLLSNIEDTDMPVLICSQPVGSTEITSVIQFIYNHEHQTWNVVTNSKGTVPFYESSIMYSKPIKVTMNAEATLEENFASWRMRHPKLAMQIAPQMIEYIQETEQRKQRNIEQTQKERTERQEEKPENLRLVEEHNAKRAAALERVKQDVKPQLIPAEWKFDEGNLWIIKPDERNGMECAGYIDGHTYSFTVPSLTPHESMSQGHGNWKKEVHDHERFSFNSSRENKNYTYDVTMWGIKTNTKLDERDRVIARHMLTTPIDVSTHPNGSEPEFIAHIRAYEIDRMLDMTAFDWSGSWTGVQVQAYFYKELVNRYPKTPAGDKEFLTKLYTFLQSEPTITYQMCQNFLHNL